MIAILNINSLCNKIIHRNHDIIGKIISIIENSNKRTNAIKRKLLNILIKHMHICKQKICILGITGSTGAGKSTFISQLSNYICANFYKRIGILTIDPVSPISQGSIMGDLIRMKCIYENKNIYARATKTNISYMSISLLTYDIILVLIAAKFDIIVVETIGTGQTNMDIYSLVDVLCLIMQPIEGDEVQIIKKGILELVNIILINKCDKDTKKLSNKTRNLYLTSLYQSNIKSILNISGLENKGIIKTWTIIKRIYFQSGYEKNISFSMFLKKIVSISLIKEFFSIYKNNIWYKRERNRLLFKRISLSQVITNIKTFIK